MFLSFTLLSIALCVKRGAPNYLGYHPSLNTLLRDCSLLSEG